MTTTVKFVPNEADTKTNEERIAFRAEQHHQDPETVVIVPFSELEGSISTVDSNIRADGQPIQMDVIGDFGFPNVIEPEKSSLLGEKLADELDSFNPLHPTDIAHQTTTFYTGDEDNPVITLVSSEEDITKLEQQATGADIDG